MPDHSIRAGSAHAADDAARRQEEDEASGCSQGRTGPTAMATLPRPLFRRPGRRPASSGDDVVVQQTDTDAAVSRLSAVRVGYLDDPFAEPFVGGLAARRLPIINRGTYIRTRAIDRIVDAFLHEARSSGGGRGPIQIISLGAGSDTRPLRLLGEPGAEDVIYHEIDFEVSCRRKYSLVHSTADLAHRLGALEQTSDGSWSGKAPLGGQYYCHAADLRRLRMPTAADGGDSGLPASILTGVPTLVLSECCLCYLREEEATRVMKVLASRIDRLLLVLYEPMPRNDSFGEVMVANLGARGIRMPSLEHCRDERDQEERLRATGFTTVGHATIRQAWDNWVAAEEKKRLDGLEGLDEVEEWQLLAEHYILAWGIKGPSPDEELERRLSARAQMGFALGGG